MEPKLPPIAIDALARAARGSSWRKEEGRERGLSPLTTRTEALDALDALAARMLWLLGADVAVR